MSEEESLYRGRYGVHASLPRDARTRCGCPRSPLFVTPSHLPRGLLGIVAAYVPAAPSRKSGRNHARESVAGCPMHVAAAVSAIVFVVVTLRAKTNGSATVSCSNRKKKKEESGRPSGRLESRESGIRCLGKIGRGPTERRVVNVAALLATRPFAVFLLRLFGPVPVSKS